MKKIPAYKISKETTIKKEPKENEILICCTEKNLNHLIKCLEDPAFISSIFKNIFNEYPEHCVVKVGVTNLNKVE